MNVFCQRFSIARYHRLLSLTTNLGGRVLRPAMASSSVCAASTLSPASGDCSSGVSAVTAARQGGVKCSQMSSDDRVAAAPPLPTTDESVACAGVSGGGATDDPASGGGDAANVSAVSCVFTEHVNPLTGRREWLARPADYDYQQEVARSAYGDMLHDGERNAKYELGLRAAIDELRARGRPVHVLDIGTGSGLLAMMAARLGADSVHACEAFAPMAQCARQVLTDNGMLRGATGDDRGDQSSRPHCGVTLIGKRSTELTVAADDVDGSNGTSDSDGPAAADLPRRCTLLVAELFDTELIGEGALGTFRHALQHLLTADCLVVPSSAVVYAQPVHSPLVRRWNRLEPLAAPAGPAGGCDEEAVEAVMRVPEDVSDCHGAASVHDLQLSQLSPHSAGAGGGFTPLCQPVPVFSFDFTGRQQALALERTAVAQVTAEHSGVAHAVLMWWDLAMDPAGTILLSCAPHWAHPDTIGRHLQQQQGEEERPQLPPWRDHWLQAVYYLPRELLVRRHEQFSLVCSHDEYSLWFAAVDSSTPVAAASPDDQQKGEGALVPGRFNDPAPICLCGLHVTLSRSRIGACNDRRRRRAFTTALAECLESSLHAPVAFLSDACLYGVWFAIARQVVFRCRAAAAAAPCPLTHPIAAAAASAPAPLFIVESNKITRRALAMYCRENDVEEHVQFVESPQALCDQLSQCRANSDNSSSSSPALSLLFAEPFFYSTTVLPWHALHIWYRKQLLARHIDSSTRVIPHAAQLWCVPVQFEHLWKIRAPVGSACHFNLASFDRVIELASEAADEKCEAHALWEYPCRALARAQLVDTLSLAARDPHHSHCSSHVTSLVDGQCNGVVLWMEWLLNASGSVRVSEGPLSEIVPGRAISWDMYSRQAVYFIRPAHRVTANQSQISFRYQFSSDTGQVDVDFTVADG